jgi:hypothetical protein
MARLALPELHRRVDASQSSSVVLIFLLDDTFVCFACNAQIEEQRPWLFEYQPSLGDGHHWSHTLVSSPPRVEPEPPALGMEERLARLEIKFDQRSAEQAQAQALFADDLNARMTRLEAMLSRLIEAHTSAS